MSDIFARRVPVRLLIASSLAFGSLVGTACGGDPQVPTTTTPSTSLTTAATVATVVSTIPSVKVLDARGKAIKSVMVRWRVTAGGGKVVNDSVRTTAAGDASSGGWTLGTVSGTQTLQATADGIAAPVTFVADAAPGPVARVVGVSPDQQQAVVNTLVLSPPSARVEDQFGNPVPGTTVSFSTPPGDGTILGAQQISNAQGIATASSWQLGTTARLQLATASVGSVPPAGFFVVAIPGPPVDLLKAGGDNQDGVNGTAISLPPGVRVVDAFANPIGNVPVTFTPGANSGTVTGSTSQTDPATGVAFVGSWVLGNATAQTLVATSSVVPGKQVTFIANVSNSLFKVDIRFVGDGGTTRQREAFTRAAARWRKIIVGHVHDVFLPAPAGACASWTPAINEVVSDVIVYARVAAIDGVGKVLAQAGPCYINTATRLTLVGVMEFDQDDMPSLLTSGTIDDVVLHEMGHVLGIGTLWDFRRALLSGAGTSDPFFTGAAARAEFPGIGGVIYSGTPVPVENSGGSGTRDSHWRNSLFGRELMQGFAAAGGMPLSRVTAASLADLGYTVSLSSADPFRLAGSLRAGPGVQFLLENDIADIPLFEVGPGGVVKLLRAASSRK